MIDFFAGLAAGLFVAGAGFALLAWRRRIQLRKAGAHTAGLGLVEMAAIRPLLLLALKEQERREQTQRTDPPHRLRMVLQRLSRELGPDWRPEHVTRERAEAIRLSPEYQAFELEQEGL